MSTETPPCNFVNRMITENKKIAMIPPAMQTQLLKDIGTTVKAQRTARIGGAILYPTLGVLGQIDMLAYTPVCVGTHHMAITLAMGAAHDVIVRGDIFEDKEVNRHFTQWMRDNHITTFSFNHQKDLMFYSKEHFSSLSLSVKVDQKHLKYSVNQTDHAFNPRFKVRNSINYFHLAADIREQIAYLLKARSRRFRSPLLSGCAGYLFGSLPFFSEHYSMSGSILGVFTSLCTNQHSVGSDTEKLLSLLKTKKTFTEIISPEYQSQYAGLINENQGKDIRVAINIFGDLVINPIFPFRQKIKLSIEKEKAVETKKFNVY